MTSSAHPMSASSRAVIGDRRLLAVMVLIALILTACGQGPLPPADLSTAATPTQITRTVPTPTPLPTLIPETAAAHSEADAERSEQDEAIDPEVPITDDEWTDVTANLEGLSSTCGNVSYVSSNPNRAQVIVNVAAHGLFEYDDTTDSWNALGSGTGSAQVNNRMQWIQYDPLQPERFWQAGAYGSGVFRTDDNGATFTRLGDLSHLDFVSVDLNDPFRSVMMVGVHEEAVIYRSEDAGATWVDISEGLPENIGFTPYPVVFDPSTYLLGTYRSNESGIFRSKDAGETWERIVTGAVSGPPLVDGNTVLWLLERGGGVVRSSDKGQTFEQGAPTGGTPRTLAKLSDGRLVTHSKNRLLVSADLGVSWTPFGPDLPYEPRGVAVTEGGESIFVWRFSCNFDGEGNDVDPLSIMRIEADFGQEL